MTEFILVITEFYTSNTDGFARHVSGSTVLWFSPLTYFTHTLISWLAHALYAPEGVAPKPEQQVQFGAALSLTTNFAAIGTN